MRLEDALRELKKSNVSVEAVATLLRVMRSQQLKIQHLTEQL